METFRWGFSDIVCYYVKVKVETFRQIHLYFSALLDIMEQLSTVDLLGLMCLL